MKGFLGKVRAFFGNRWVKFALVTTIYVLWFVVWTRSLWFLIGVPLIYDIYISKIGYRLIWKKHKERKKANKAYREVWSWIEAILFAVVAASLIHVYIFQMYKIPTSSMEKTLLVGDYLCVSKVTYGPRMPNTPLSFPLVHNTMPLSITGRNSYSEAIQWPYKRLAGFRNVERNDIVVFNFPAGDTVSMREPMRTYYDIVREYERRSGEHGKGSEAIRRNTRVIFRPVDKREHYVKRCVGIPGDTVFIAEGQLYINGEPQKRFPGTEFHYEVKTTSPISRSAFERMGLSYEDIIWYDRSEGYYTLALTESNLETVRKMSNVEFASRVIYRAGSNDIFPNDENFDWTVDNFGPLWVPVRGATVELTPGNLPIYTRIIRNYEGNELEAKDGKIFINGQPADSYTFEMDYYFMMGDNRHNSADSRYWGFVPQDHIVGTPAFIWWSRDPDTGKVRWNRIFSSPD